MTDGWTFRTRIETHMLTGAVTLWQVRMGPREVLQVQYSRQYVCAFMHFMQ